MTDPAAANAVEIRDLFRLHRGRAGDVAALRGLTLTVGAGERVVVHGPNGSGKTTLLRVLTGEQQPSAGTVAVAGQDLQNADEAALARLRSGVLGLVDQHRSRSLRPELDVRDNVALHQRIAGVSARRARSAAEELLGSLGIGDLARRDVTTLSGGEAQRVAICAALAHVPSVVLADEPTGDLDTDNAEAVYDLLAAATASAGSALLLVTHDSRAGRIADRVVRIRDGRVSEQWQPTSAVETVLVDDRGWLRLPEHLRSAAGVTTGVHVSERAGRIVLTPPSAARSSTEGAPVTQAEPVPGAVVAAMHGIGHAVGGRRLFDGVDLTARRGCLTVVRGPSGTGKSTLLRLLVGLEDPASGQVQICGTDLAALSRADRARLRRRLVAVAGQGKALAESLDVEGNVALARSARGLPADRSAVDAAVAAVGLTSLARRDVAVLSGGERQRVALARVLVSEAPLVVLDEPTSSLDEAGATRVGDLLAGLARAGAAVVAATHDPVLVTRADEVLEVPRVGFEPTRHRV